MSFDTNPPKYERFLICHPESDSYFEVFTRAEMENILTSEPCCFDVTGVDIHENSFKNLSAVVPLSPSYLF